MRWLWLGLQIDMTKEHFVTVAKVGGILQIVEKFPLDGAAVRLGRRDMRRGYSEGCIQQISDKMVAIG